MTEENKNEIDLEILLENIDSILNYWKAGYAEAPQTWEEIVKFMEFGCTRNAHRGKTLP